MAYQIPTSDPVQFEFRGRAGEWFGIWIVNLLLSIITIGIYSAWAKVRAKKYFNQNTWVAGRNFDYHATGMQILIGRLIVVGVFFLFSLLSAIPILGILMPIALLIALPFLLVRSMRFNAVMSSWSNVRFGFDGTAGKAALVYILYPILTVFTLYLAFPFADRAIRRFAVSNHRLGRAPFAFDAAIGGFYRGFFAALAWVVVVGLVGFVLLSGQVRMLAAMGPQPADPALVMRVLIPLYLLAFLAFLPAGAIYQAFVRNVVFNGTTLDGKHRFASDVAPLTLVWIVVSNTLAVICTLGLMLPWAQIRLARYYAEHTRLIVAGSVDDLIGKAEAQAGALGDAYTDLDGIDVGLPV